MSIKPLYKISNDLEGLNRLISDGDVTVDMIADTMEGVELMFNEKAEGIVTIANGFKHNVDIIDSEIKRLTDMKNSLVSKQSSLKEYLRVNMERTGTTKISCDLFTITLRKPTKRVLISNESEIPDEYVTVKTVIAPDKRQILAALKDGADIPGAELELGKSSILIK